MRSGIGVALVLARDAGVEILLQGTAVAGLDLAALCDLRQDPARQDVNPVRVPRARELGAVLRDDAIDAVAIAAPPRARGALVLRALEADKHVFVLGAPAQDPDEVTGLVALARHRPRCLFDVYETEFRPSVQRLRDLVVGGATGDLFYVSGVHREPPGSGAAGRLWELCEENVATVLGLVRDEPIAVEAHCETYASSDVEVVHAHLRFATGITAHLELSRLDASCGAETRVVAAGLTAIAREHAGADSLELVATEHDVAAVPGVAAFRLLPGDAVVRAAPAVPALQTALAGFVHATRSRRPVRLHDPVAVAATVERIRATAGVPAAARHAFGAKPGLVAL